MMPDKTAPVCVCPERKALATWKCLVIERGIEILKRFRLAERQCDFGPFDDDIEVLDVGKVLWVNKWFVIRICGSQSDCAS